jgi:hypothetical protein
VRGMESLSFCDADMTRIREMRVELKNRKEPPRAGGFFALTHLAVWPQLVIAAIDR